MNFIKRYQKIFLIILFLGVSFLIGYFLWRFFFKTTPSVEVPTGTGTISGLPLAGLGSSTPSDLSGGANLPGGQPTSLAPDQNAPAEVADGGLTKTDKLSDATTLNPTLSSDGKVQYYDQNDGKFYKIDENGNATLLSDRVFYDVDNIVWAPGKDKAILEYPDGSKILYNFSTGKQSTLPAHWENFSFSPDGGQIVSKSLGIDPENRWLVISSDDGSKATALEKIGTNDKTVYPSWSPNQQMVAMYTQGVDFNRQEVFFVGQNEENFKSTIIEGRGFKSTWSTAGDKLLYSVYNTSDNLNPRLWIVDASSDSIGQNRISLDLMTWADKCTFATNDELYCAVPESLPEGAGLFPELADNSKDNLYKIDLKTGSKQLLAVPDGTYNISNIIVPQDQSYLYFTDKKTNQLYKIAM
jgi:hypothetical protein